MVFNLGGPSFIKVVLHSSGWSFTQWGVPSFHSSRWSFIHHGGSSFIGAVLHSVGCSFIHQGGPSFIRVVLHSSGWSFIHQGGPSFIRVVLHSSGWSFIHQGGPSLSGVFLHSSGWSFTQWGGPSFIRVVFHQGFLCTLNITNKLSYQFCFGSITGGCVDETTEGMLWIEIKLGLFEVKLLEILHDYALSTTASSTKHCLLEHCRR